MVCLGKTIALTLAAALLHAGAHAQDVEAERLRGAMKDTPVNSFRYVGDQLVCKQDTPTRNYLACLRVGPVRIGDSYRRFRERHPGPWQELAPENGIAASAHPAATDGKTYWVIGRRDDRIVSIQLTGNRSSPDLAFATLQLGDSEERAIALLGPRANISAVPEIGGLIWNYAPFPISIEFVDGKVFSIKITEPGPAP